MCGLYSLGISPYLIVGKTQSGRTSIARKAVLEHPEISKVWFDSGSMPSWQYIKEKLDSNKIFHGIYIIDDVICFEDTIRKMIETTLYKDKLLTIIVCTIKDMTILSKRLLDYKVIVTTEALSKVLKIPHVLCTLEDGNA